MVVSCRLYDWMACSLQLKAGHLNIRTEFFPEWDGRKQAGSGKILMICYASKKTGKYNPRTKTNKLITSPWYRGREGLESHPHPPHLGFRLNCPA